MAETMEQRHPAVGRTLPAVFAAAVAAGGDAPAILDAGRSLTWTDWRDEAHAAADRLRALGVRPGDVVALHLPNGRWFPILHVSVALAGAVTLPLHMAYGEYELTTLLRRTGARLLMLPERHGGRDLSALPDRLRDAAPTLVRCVVVGEHGLGAATPPVHRGRGERPAASGHVAERPRPSCDVPRPDPADPFVLLPSSGTTSQRPKICVHVHDGLLSNAAAVAADAAIGAGDTLISASPFSHAFGMLSIHLSLFGGCGQAMLPRWDAAAFADAARRSGATVAFMVPAQLRDLLTYRSEHPGERIRLREIRTGGAAVPADLVTAAGELLGARIVVQWGMSEVGAGLFTRPGDPLEAVTGSVGRPVTGARVRVVADDGAEAPVGVPGELWFRGPSMFRGYFGDPELTAAAVTEDGWLRTGDLASRNPDGTVAFRGRRSDLINRGGLKFSVVEVEGLLSDMTELAHYAITARADERLGERAVLVAVPRDGRSVSLGDVHVHLAAKGLAKYKWPEELMMIGKLPVTATGKVSRGRLRTLVRREPR